MSTPQIQKSPDDIGAGEGAFTLALADLLGLAVGSWRSIEMGGRYPRTRLPSVRFLDAVYSAESRCITPDGGRAAEPVPQGATPRRVRAEASRS